MGGFDAVTAKLVPHFFDPFGLLGFVDAVGRLFVVLLLKFSVLAVKFDVLVLDFAAEIFGRNNHRF